VVAYFMVWHEESDEDPQDCITADR